MPEFTEVPSPYGPVTVDPSQLQDKADPRPPVPEALGRLDREIDLISERIGELIARLDPVLRSRSDEHNPIPEPAGADSVVGRTVNGYATRVRIARDALEETIARLEV